MAVLKRGDRAETLELDASRRFASSFAMGWNLWIAHIKSFCRLSWEPGVLAGVLVVVWYAIGSSLIVFGPSVSELLLHFVFGASLLFVYSTLRVRQVDLLMQLLRESEADSHDQSANSAPRKASGAGRGAVSQADGAPMFQYFRSFVSLSKRAVRPYMPLLMAWALCCVMVFVPQCLMAHSYIQYAAIAVAALLLVPMAGMAQSYVEHAFCIQADPSPRMPLSYWSVLGSSLRLCRRYFGGMLAMWIISAILLLIAACLMLFGQFIVEFAHVNEVIAFMQKEEAQVPSLLYVAGYMIMFGFAFMMMLISPILSLPQQIHIRSIIYKVAHRPRHSKNNR